MKNLLILALSFFVLSACNSQGKWGKISGEGSAVNKTLSLSSFHGLSNSINANVNIRQGSSQSIAVNAQQNIIDNLKLTVKEGILHIGYKENVGKCITPNFEVVLPKLNYVSLTGSGDIKGAGFSGGEKLELRLTGSGKIHMDASASNVEARITGSGNIYAQGSANNGSIRMTGSGSFKGEGFSMQSAELRMTGSGSAHVKVADVISGTITGSGSVVGYGDPASVKLKVTGSGRYKQS